MTRLRFKARREADAVQLANVLRAFARAHGAPVSVTAAELARRATDATTTYTPMRVGNAAARVVQLLAARGWRLVYDERKEGASYPAKMFVVTREGQ